jgi:hypothetical protein
VTALHGRVLSAKVDIVSGIILKISGKKYLKIIILGFKLQAPLLIMMSVCSLFTG